MSSDIEPGRVVFAVGLDAESQSVEVISGGNDSRLILPLADLPTLTAYLQSFDPMKKASGEVVDMSPYCGDDYDRVGCTVSIAVTATYYGVVIRAPNGAVIESWGAREPSVLARRLAAWCRGREPDGQLSESKS